jgi:hypothetical protein
MAFTIVDATGQTISAKISGELSKSEVSQMQAAALAAIRRCGKISALFILENFRGWKREAMTEAVNIGVGSLGAFGRAYSRRSTVRAQADS